MNAQLSYIADSLIIEALAKDEGLVVFAQEGIIGSVAQGVKDYVMSQFDRNRPIASIAAFLGRGLLWSMGFKWMSVLYTVAEALGFDWKAFWSSVGRGITTFAKTIMGSKEKPSEEEASQKINDVVEDSFKNNFSGDVDKGRLLDIAQGKYASDLQNALQLKAIAIKIQDGKLKKTANVLSLFRGKLSRFFIKTIGWLIRTALVSLGLVAGAGAVTGLLGMKPNVSNDSPDSTDSENPSSPQAPAMRFKVSPNVSRDMFTVHPNNMSSVWIERADIQNVDSLLQSWIINIYPQLKQYISQIESSAPFQSMVAKFTARNRLANGLGMLSIPRPYQRKADIVSEIVSSFNPGTKLENESNKNDMYK